MTRMLIKGWVLASSESGNIAAAEDLGVAPPAEIRLVEFVDRITKYPAEWKIVFDPPRVLYPFKSRGFGEEISVDIDP